jgi:hypothetical protein
MTIYKSPKLIEEEKLAEEAKKPKLEYYTVEVEAMVPTTFKYKVYATSAEEALSKINNSPLLETPKQKLSQMKRLQAKVFKFGTHLLKYSKKL